MMHMPSLSMLCMLFVMVSSLPTVTLKRSLLFDKVGNVSVVWEGIPHPTAADVVAIHTLGLDVQTQDAFLKFQYANKSISWENGSGSSEFALLNTRFPFVARYWSRGNVVSSSDPVYPDFNYPQQGHLSLTGKESEMRISWVTHNASDPVVWYGTSKDKLDRSATGATTTYSKDDLERCNASDTTALTHFFPPGLLHSAVMIGLTSGQQFYYKFGSKKAGVSDVFSFTTSQSTHTNILYLADAGIGAASLQELGGELGHAYSRYNDGAATGTKMVLKRILERENLLNYSFAFHNGDISYACGLGTHWDYFMNMAAPIATSMPYMVSVGNHEMDSNTQEFLPKWSDYGNDSGGECGIPTVMRFPFPGFSVATPYYSFVSGPVHFAVVALEVDFLAGSPQALWLDADLKKVDRARTPWVIVAHHRPMYGTGKTLMELHAIESLEPIYLDHKVDLVLEAHQHYYQRTCSVIKGKCHPNGPVHVLDGTAGAYGSKDPVEDFVRFRDYQYGYSRIGASHSSLTLDHIAATTGTVIDSVTLTN